MTEKNTTLPSEKDYIRVFSDVFHLSKKPLLSGSEFDDCAAVRLDSFCRDLSLESLTFSTDTVRESTDFPSAMTMWQKGWMAAAVNLSDLAAMGSKPIAFLFSVGLPPIFSLDDAVSLARGVQDCLSFFGAEVIGGDTEVNEELTITGTIIGLSENKKIFYRKNAKPGDLLCVTGNVGSAGAALFALLHSTNSLPSDAFLKNLTEPFPRVFESLMLLETEAVTSMIDTSDGLAASIYELSSLSGVGFEIDIDALPLEDEALGVFSDQSKESAKEELIQQALYTGGDYELLFTVSPDKLEDVKAAFQKFNARPPNRLNEQFGKSGHFPCLFTVIGKAMVENENVISRHSNIGLIRQPLLKKGYDSFKKYI